MTAASGGSVTKRPTPIRSRIAPPSLRIPSQAISPRTVASLLELMSRARAAAAPPPAKKPVRIPRVKPTIIGMDAAPGPDIGVEIEIAPPPAEKTRSSEDGAMGSRGAGDSPVSDPAPQPIVAAPRPAPFRRAALEATPRRPLPTAQILPAADRQVASRSPVIGRRSPIEQASIAIAWLREQRISVSVAATGIHGTRWNIANEGRTFGAADVVAFAVSRGWSA